MTQEPGHSLRSRAPYLPIHKRPRLSLPDGARVAVWTIVNVENWSPLGPMPRTVLPPPMGNPLLPDVPNWAWHEYGMRVGFWRFLEALGARSSRRRLPSTARPASSIARPARRRSRRAGSSWATASCSGQCIGSRIRARRSATPSRQSGLHGKPPRGWESPG